MLPTLPWARMPLLEECCCLIVQAAQPGFVWPKHREILRQHHEECSSGKNDLSLSWLKDKYLPRKVETFLEWKDDPSL